MTTGVDIVGSLLREFGDLTAIVPADRIKAGALPDGVALPAILVRVVSSIEHQPLKRAATTRNTDRVSATVRAASYRDQRAVIALIKRCCAGRTGNIGGGVRVSILTAGTGPDGRGPGDTYEQGQDFAVSHDV